MRVVLALVAILFALAPAPAHAAEIRGGSDVTIGPTQVVNDDLYVSGGTVSVQGRINGDLVSSGGTLSVQGPVAGDVIVAGGTVDLAGPVGGSVRAAGGNLTIRSRVTKDVLVAGGTVTLAPVASVGRDLLVATGSAVVDGPVARNVMASTGDLTLGSRVGGNVAADADTLRLTNGAFVSGNLTYTSGRQAVIAPGATVRGRIERRQPPAEVPSSPLARIGQGILNWMRALVGLFVLGLGFVLLFPRFGSRAIGTMRDAPWASLGLGFALLVGVPVLAVVVFALGLLVGGWWLSLALLAVYGIALALSYVVTGLFVGCWVADRLAKTNVSLVGALLAGLVLLLLIGVVPVIGAIIGLVAVVLGLGTLALTVARLRGGQPVSSATPL